jgi:uncharacterized protein (DUF1330 family)
VCPARDEQEIGFSVTISVTRTLSPTIFAEEEAAMKPQYALAMAVVVGTGLGALVVEGIHAQAKPPVYYIAEIDVTNPDAYAKEYAPKAQALIKNAGGRFLAIGGAAGGATVTGFDGPAPKRVVVQVWDSMEKIQAWRANPEYQELRKTGDKYAKFRSYAVEGLSESAAPAVGSSTPTTTK